MKLGKWWHIDSPSSEGAVSDETMRIVCDLCPRQCRMKEGDRGFCFVRKIENNQLMLDTYGRSTGFCIDPIEKKPLNHFYPGSSVLSFGTAGCNLGCQFCQNWDISKSREVAKLSEIAEPATIARAAKELGCKSVAFTYNDPVIWAEYAIDTAAACHELGIATVAVTAGYIMPQARREFYAQMDAANVDLKAFTEDFYRRITYSHLDPVLDTLRYLKHETDVWFEITNLIIPSLNDSHDELKSMCDWILRELGDDVPVHFSAFHPDFRMLERPRTPHETLLAAHQIATEAGIRYAYVGNVHDKKHASTYCYQCKSLLIERDWYDLGSYNLSGNLCRKCGAEQSGRFDVSPGAWGRKRLPVNLESFRVANAASPNRRLSLPVVEPATEKRHPTPDQPFQSSRQTTEETMAVTAPVKLPMLQLDTLTSEQKHAIQKAAQLTVISAVIGRPLTSSWDEVLGELGDQYVFGLFTTLSRGMQLRGCCGFLGRPTTLREAILQSAQRTAKEDHRMAAISPTELPHLSLDVSVLASPAVLQVPAEKRFEHIQIGKHGLRVARGNQAGLLLPSVPSEQGWDNMQFLEAVCRKAGLPENAWQDSSTQLEIFEGVVVEGKIESDSLPSDLPVRLPPGTMAQLMRLKQVATDNVVAFTRGSTPSYVALDAMNGTVHGVVLTLRDTKNNRMLANWIQTSIRPGIPLQTSVFDLCKNAAQALVNARFAEETKVELELTVLYDPIHHGVVVQEDWDGDSLTETYRQCDVSEVNPSHRAIIALCGERCAVAFEANKSVHELIQQAANPIRMRRNPVAIFSMSCVSTASSLIASNGTVALESDVERPPAVAGSFYPAKKEERERLFAEFAEHRWEGPKIKPLAIMTPHAGLRFSGRTALEVWSRIEFPENILILGPKHTPYGCDWAVSPSKAWKLPESADWPANVELAKAIADEVEGMEMDAGAHASEHGLEIQLPVLESILPANRRPKITGIVFRGANWEEIERASQQLAAVLKQQAELPLLVISSDLNHYQPEAENRRRDHLAIEAMMNGDPKHLIDVCRKNSISMCGLVPAAVVMQTLIALEKPFRVEKVGYSNSADQGGDPNRVVGYAGMLILPK
ncbi:MAG: AmmeMemoRadiSam system radical SAM enzyme [Planctomycetes bacterium]|nr:AmmeMemoRadiSam system radical SAM enzyme [Planctomycetota bacterium]